MANGDDQSAGVPKWLGQVCSGIAGGPCAGGHYLLSEVTEHVREVKHQVASLHDNMTHSTNADTSLSASADAHSPAGAHHNDYSSVATEQPLNLLGTDPVQFSGWEKGSSGYWYEYDPDGNYTGNWSA